jgi:predicted metalloprotease with PDZ domain
LFKAKQNQMQYFISRTSEVSQFIQIRLDIQFDSIGTVDLQLPLWRPGRYEFQNFAQKIRGLSVYHLGMKVPNRKKNKSCWQFDAHQPGIFSIQYEFYANQMDAGGCWSDDQQLYLNFSNFCFAVSGKSEESIAIHVELPADYFIATSLPTQNGYYTASNYQHLIDSPFMSGKNMAKTSYREGGINFHMCFLGLVYFDMDRLVKIFKSFTRRQLEAFGELPIEDYYFLFQLLPYKHYHGVEHAASTVITFGPAADLSQKSSMDELIGVSSHELYHAWNVCRIRPAALLPYDLSKEVYLDEGLVLEGVTTYMGDLYLLKSAYFQLEDYLKILQFQIQKEMDHWGWQNQSITASSWDLWLDGYKAGIPDKKVSIYNRGALISLCLDLMLIKSGSSLEQIMHTMWTNYGKQNKGYVLNDFQEIAGNYLHDKEEAKYFFSSFVYGKENLLPLLLSLLSDFGIGSSFQFDAPLLNNFGLKTDNENVILKVHPESPAYQAVMIGDKIISIKTKNYEELGKTNSLELEISRYGRELDVLLEQPTPQPEYFPSIRLIIGPNNPLRRIWAT